jgi:hypothetical protein
VLVWLHRVHPARYVRARRVLGLATMAALLGFWLLPTAPPRLLPGEGFVDTMAAWSRLGWWGAAASAPRGLADLSNQYAAVPSLHVGWALWCAWQISSATRRRSVKALAWGYPLLTVLVVVGTANHYVLDAVAGAAVIAVAALLLKLPDGARLPGALLLPVRSRRGAVALGALVARLRALARLGEVQRLWGDAGRGFLSRVLEYRILPPPGRGAGGRPGHPLVDVEQPGGRADGDEPLQRVVHDRGLAVAGAAPEPCRDLPHPRPPSSC